MPCQTESPIPLAGSTPSPSSSASSNSEATNVTTKGKKSCAKSPNWTEAETFDLLQARGPKYENLRSASQQYEIAWWNEIYSMYKECHLGSTRTLVQVKKPQKSVEYESNQLKQPTRSTVKNGIKSCFHILIFLTSQWLLRVAQHFQMVQVALPLQLQM